MFGLCCLLVWVVVVMVERLNVDGDVWDEVYIVGC